DFKELIIEKDKEVVWSIITDPNNIKYLDWRGPKLLLGDDLQIGVELGCAPTSSGFKRKLYIVEMVEPKLLSLGRTPTDWNTQISLARRPGGTTLILERKFTPLIDPWWGVLFYKFIPDPVDIDISNESLLDQDLKRIAKLFGESEYIE
ncbi:MAG: hypothetical protein AB2652_21270, partial [Candidatus Thiodiazotropha endolucinida]